MILRVRVLLLTLAACCVLAGLACSAPGREAGRRKVIVLGVDGMDPRFVERHWDALTNLNRLRGIGEFKRLATTTPPQSPVAWSTFATGLDPAEHEIYDFVHRDPSTLQPFSSFAETEAPSRTIALGPWVLPLNRGRVRSFRKGETFWEALGREGVAATVIHMPANYPAAHFRGTALAGMGAPDLRGTFGSFTLYTDSPFEQTREVAGGRVVKTDLSSNRTRLEIAGPANPLRAERPICSVPMTVEVDPVDAVARFTVPDRQFILRQGEWSDWIPVQFLLIPALARAHGIFRVYAAQLHPGLRVYVSPVNIDPANPDLPISWPESYSRELAGALGPFYTQGIREDTSALREGALNPAEYLSQSRQVLDEDLALFRYELRRFREGFLFFYFSSIDQNSHVLWGAHEAELLETYRAVDRAVGEAMRAQPGAVLIVMSDHGFTSFTRSFNLNTWLLEHGYLALRSRTAAVSEELFADVDWPRTRAYSIGLNALYLNLAGRERSGVVLPGPSAGRLLDEISAALLEARDPENGARVVASVEKLRISSKFSPDLIVGYAAGYRASWEGALGAVENRTIQHNGDAWIGDHCVAASEVPGVLFSNHRSSAGDPELRDLPVSVLRLLDVAPPPRMSGRAIY